jgi:hypothetical protein
MRIMWRWVAQVLCAAMAVTLMACSGPRTVYQPDGSKGYAITCKGVLNSWSSCLEKAGKLCGTRGYNTLRSEEYDREMMISCKSATAAH